MEKLVCDKCGFELTEREDIDLAFEGQAAWQEALTYGTMSDGPRLDRDLMFEDVFKEMPQSLVRQRASMRAERG